MQVVFSGDGSGPVKEWGSLDDVVMGGVSSSSFSIRQGGALGTREEGRSLRCVQCVGGQGAW